MNLSLLILIPLVTALAIPFCKGLNQVRWISFLGSALQLLLAFGLLIFFWQERSSGNTSQFIFQQSYAWYARLNIHYHIGVDGISVAMILLTSFVVFAGVLVSWSQSTWSKEFFFLLM